MAFNFDSQIDVGGRPAWRFVNETGSGYLESNPMRAAQMGAPVPGLTKPQAPPVPDPRLALAPGEDMTGAAMAQTAGPYQVQGAPPEAPPQVSDVEIKNQIMAEAAARQAAASGGQPGAMPVSDVQRREPSEREQALRVALNNEVPLGGLPQQSSGMVYSAPVQEGYVNQGRKVSGPDEERIDQRRQAIGEIQDAKIDFAKRQMERDLYQADAERAGAATEATLRQIEMAEAEAEKAQLERYYKDGWDSINRDAQEASKASADPNRFLNNKGFGGKLMAAVMIGIGEYGSRMSGGGPNLAHTIIQNAIDKDIQQQRDEIAANKEAVGERRNAFARELADGKDPKFAEAKLKYLANLHAEAVARESAAAARDPRIRAAFEQTALSSAEEAQKLYLELDKLQQIEATQKWQQGRSGGWREMTAAERAKDAQARAAEAEANDKVRNIYSRNMGLPAEMDTDAVAAANKSAAVSQAQSGSGQETQQYQRALQVAGVPEAEKQLDNLKQMESLMEQQKLDEIPTPQSRNVAARAIKGAADFVGGAGAGMSLLGYSDAERELVSRQQEIDNAVRKETFGAALSEFDKGEFAAQAVDTNKLSGIKRRIAQLQRGIDATKAAIAGGYNPGAVQTYEKRAEQYRPENQPKYETLELESP